MTLSGNTEAPVYRPSENVPGVGVPEQDDDGDSLGGLSDESLSGDFFDDVLGGSPSVASTKIAKPDMGLAVAAGNPMYFDELGNLIDIEAVPTTRDYSKQISDALNRLSEQTSITGVSNVFTNSVIELMAIPEFVSFINELNTDEMFESNDEALGTRTGKAILGEMAADVGVQVLTAMYNADTQRLLTGTALSTDQEIADSTNMIGFFDMYGSEMEPQVRQIMVSLGTSLPTQAYVLPAAPVSGNLNVFNNIFRGISGDDFQSVEEFSEAAASPHGGRNFREEFYIKAAMNWGEKPPRTQEEIEQYVTWAYSFAQQKSSEAKGIDSHLGSLGYVLDIPRQTVVGKINDTINAIAFPNSTLDRSHLPAGDNIAYAFGMESTDGSPSWIFEQPIVKTGLGIAEFGVNVAIPVIGGASIYNMTQGEGAYRTPFVSDFLDEFKQTNSFELTSGGFQLSTFFWADPWNWGAAAGLGYKAAQTIPRFQGVTRAMQFRRAVTPLRGASQTGVKGGLMARGVHALASDTVVGLVRSAREGSRVGNRLIRAFRTSDSPAEVMRKVPQLEGNRLVAPLKRLIDNGDVDQAWDLIELSMTGAQEASNPFLFNSIKTKAGIAMMELHDATKISLGKGEIGIRDVMTGLFGSHPNATLYNSVGEVRATAGQPGAPRVILQAVDEASEIASPLVHETMRTAIDYRQGWQVADAFDDVTIKQIREVDPSLADELVNIRDRHQLAVAAGNIPEELTTRLEHAIDDVLEADAIQLGDDILVGRTSEHKLFSGLDITTPENHLQKAMPQQTADAVQATIVSDLLEGSDRTVMLIDQMPRPKLSSQFWDKAAVWAGANSNSRTARFGRRLSAAARYVSPGDIDPSKKKQGLENLSRRLKIHGASRPYQDAVTNAWINATTSEERYQVAMAALRGLGDEVNAPALFSQYSDQLNRLGETGYGKRVVDGGYEEIGAAKRADGTYYIAPTLEEHHRHVIQLGDAYIIEKEAARYRRSRRMPDQLVVGWGKTNKRRTGIAAAYRKQIIEERGINAWHALGKDEAARSNVAMSLAFADSSATAKASMAGSDLGRTGRGSGLGRVNRAFSAVNRAHKGFHTTFTLAQLAGRPFAWASRVLLEEHVRGWLSGLPTLINNPTAYLANFWNAEMVDHTNRMMRAQMKQADASAKLLFGSDMPIADALKIADEIIPGWSAKAAKEGITGAGQLRGYWTSTLSRALNNNRVFTSNRAGGITGRVLRKEKSLDRVVRRHDEWFGFDPREETWAELGAEMTGASIIRPFANEADGAVGEMRFTPNLKRKSRAAISQAHATKAHQILGGQSGKYAVNRMLQKLRGETVTATGERFVRTRAWSNIRHNIEDVARARNFTPRNEADLADWYLDVIVRQDWIEGNFKYFWGDSPGEKVRILDEILAGKTATIEANGTMHTVNLKPNKYAEGKQAWTDLFDGLDAAGRHEEVLPVMGVMNAYFAEQGADINRVKKISNWVLQTFGEAASQKLHRRPAYLAERRRHMKIYEGLGFGREEATQLAHEKAYETVNWLFFNNHHTGQLLRNMNSTIPFFSAWAEVMSTWAWKIPSQNVLGLGHAQMIHKIDNLMQGMVRLGLVDIDDNGQWRINVEEESAAISPAGRGLSQMGHAMYQNPTTAVAHLANIGNWLRSQVTGEEYEAMNVSDWARDSYSIAIGSPVKLGSRGLGGVNQISFGFTPAASYGSDVARNFAAAQLSRAFPRLQIGGDTQIIKAETLADAYDQMPESASQSEFLALNEEIIIDRIGLDMYNELYKSGFEFIPPASVDLSGLPLQMPGTSWFDQNVDPILYPFGHIDSVAGVIRSVVPSTASYMLRGAALWADGSFVGEGANWLLTGPLQQYQVDGQAHAAIMHLEATEGTWTKINALKLELLSIEQTADAGDTAEKAQHLIAGTPEAKRYAQVQERLENAEAAAAKRMTDMTASSTFSLGMQGFFTTGTPKSTYEDQRYKSEFYATKEIAEVLNERGDFDWTPLFETGAIKSTDDFMRANIEIEKWYNDPSGSEVKAFLLESYPSLLAWTNPSTFWGPAGPPPKGRDIDITMDAVLAGSKQRLPDDIVIQKVSRYNVDHQYEINIRLGSGTTDQVDQALWALNNPAEYNDAKSEKRYGIKSLDWFDDHYNSGDYQTYRESADDASTLYEEWEENLFAMTDAVDEVLEMVEHTGIADNAQLDEMIGIARASLSAQWGVRDDALEALGIGREFRRERDEFLYEHGQQVVRPYADAISEAFKVVDEAESAAERAVGFEMLRAAKDEHYGQQHFVEFNGLTYRVPNELQRRWDMKSEEDKTEQVQEWAATNVEWLSEFAVDKMVERREGYRKYLPWEQRPQRIIANATKEKSALLDEIRGAPREWTSYEKRIALDNIEAEMQNNLVAAGYPNIVQYMEAWPMERLVIAGALPPEMNQVAGWFIGIHNDLDSIGKSITSDAGEDMFTEFGHTLDAYFETHPDQEAKFKDVGFAMFNEEANWALYYRFAGIRQGEAGP